MIGIGRMGGAMVLRLKAAGYACVAYARHPKALAPLVTKGAVGTTTYVDFVAKLEKPRAIWMMVPAASVDGVLASFVDMLEPGDVKIDGGNSYYHDDIRRAAALEAKDIHYLDVGVSGGVWGMERGFCHMIGGDHGAVRRLDPIFRVLAPGVATAPRTSGASGKASPAEEGYLDCGPSGAGHFVKMVHNGVKYGMMESYAEGLKIIANAGVGLAKAEVNAETAPLRHPELYAYDINIAEVAKVWRRGSVVSSWLLDLAASALRKSPHLDDFAGGVSDSGEGRWTLQASIDEGVPAPVISAAPFARFGSRDGASFADKLLSALRYEFGGHDERAAPDLAAG
jgi:6-phosphogluconate dehydrogenase